MIASMTGFARRELAGSWGTLTCELRSVNHRYLEPGFRLPEELRPLESDLRQLLAKSLKRGKVDCTMHLRGAQAAERELRVDATALARVAAAMAGLLDPAAASCVRGVSAPQATDSSASAGARQARSRSRLMESPWAGGARPPRVGARDPADARHRPSDPGL